MAIFKRYNTRKRRINRGFILWLAFILAVFIITALIGNYLGNKAKDKEIFSVSTEVTAKDGLTASPIADGSIHGEYAEPEDIAKFKSDDPSAVVGTWLYNGGKSAFKTETDTLLGNGDSKLPSLSVFNTEVGTYGLFEVTAIYADDKVYDVVASYEISLINEFSENGPNELVLVFNEVTEENYGEIIDFAVTHSKNKLICIPYETLREDFCSRLFSSAWDKHVTVALMVKNLKIKQLTEDIETFGFYFTRYNMRLLLPGDKAYLLDTLAENNVLNYQFYSQRETED